MFKLNKLRVFAFMATVIVALNLVFMGSLWQLEIADNFLLNDWGDFNFLFTWIYVDVWAARDFFMFIMLICVILISTAALYYLGKDIMRR